GQVLASSSYDRTVRIWEEPATTIEDSTKKDQKKGWTVMASLVDSTESVVDIKFSPRHLGLQLATCSLDGHVRIYEAIDVMNLSHWPLSCDFDCKIGVTTISWNPSKFDDKMLLVGCIDGSSKIFTYNENFKKWQHAATLEDTSVNSNKSH